VPLYRRLLGVQAAALGVLAVSTENLGGMLLGTAAAIMGGAIAFRWQSAGQRPAAQPVMRVLEAVPPIHDDDPTESAESLESAPSIEAVNHVEREVERTAELEPTSDLEPALERSPAPKLALVASGPIEHDSGRHEAPRPRPAVSVVEDDLVARAESHEQSFIPGF